MTQMDCARDQLTATVITVGVTAGGIAGTIITAAIAAA